MRATGRHTRLARTAASGAPAVRFGQLHCYVDSLNALWKTVTADSPEVAATDRTNYTDREVVYFRSRLWENGGADVLNGTGWYPAEGWTGWQSQTVDDAHFGRAWHGWQWQLFDGQKTHAVENQIYFSSTGKTIPYWSSDAQGLRVYCGTQGYMRRF